MTIPAGAVINLNFVNAGVNLFSFAIVDESVDLFAANEEAVLQRINAREVEGGDCFPASMPDLAPARIHTSVL